MPFTSDLQEAITDLDRCDMATLLHNILPRLEAIDAALSKLGAIEAACQTNMERTTPKSTCSFCTLDENRDSHYTSRCSRYPDPVSRTAQAAKLQLCLKCLKPGHEDACERPLNKIYPLEIRSVSEKPDTGEQIVEETNEKLPIVFERSEPAQKIVPQMRQILPRASKTRAHDFFRNMDGDSNQASGAISTSSSLIFLTVLCAMMSPAIAINNSTIISCSNGVVNVPPLKGWFELCIDNDCQSMNNTTRYVKYLLPISPTEKGAKVRLRTLSSDGVQEQQWLCDRPKFCEHQYFLSKSLLGNPHCWPAGAIASSAVLIYIIIAVIMGIIWIAVKITNKLKSPKIAVEPGRNKPEVPTAPVCSFELTPLPSTLLVLCTLICLMSTTGACQHGFMRHSADLVCNEKNQCHLEYSRELLFNRLQSELCIEILHGNRTVGTAKFTKKSIDFECSKATEFYTRPTKLSVYHAKRCATAGSCNKNKCETIKQNETVHELRHASKYPGYSGCMNSCGGIFCGCGLPLPSCWFYKIAHRPVSDRIFEIVQCPHWTTTVKLEIEVTIGNRTEKVERSFTPYMVNSIDNFNITVISIQRPLYPLENKRFAIAKDKSYLLPPNFQVAVACNTPTQALKEFSTCSNRIQCNCGNSPRNCQCPDDSFQKLCDNPQSTLPLKTAHANINVREGNIVATSNEEEMVLRIESKMLQDVVAELVINQECGFKISKLTGCYDCTLGAHFTAICKSPSKATVTVTCQSQQFLVTCGPSEEENEIILNFNHPIVNEQCNAHCSDRPTKFLLNGTLHYQLMKPQDIPVFEMKAHGVPLNHQWFNDISLPNIDPFLHTITSHWKLTLVALGTTLGFATLTYLGGPIVCVYILSFANSILCTVTKGMWALFLYLIGRVRATHTNAETAIA
ncbi:hypothetical protein TELCIR_19370 [Teladorsagia circumcincta]|uniref:Phlebovirus glycoprotein G2 fusion domain-containing protein n=1 Tax=Teladorsagia circumcincta TaxID=45464 RepID=A0A2G9TML7_TELCI|nr:hypothetical protein TELCIR_19370 [Teladorsagia circumcincta]